MKPWYWRMAGVSREPGFLPLAVLGLRTVPLARGIAGRRGFGRGDVPVLAIYGQPCVAAVSIATGCSLGSMVSQESDLTAGWPARIPKDRALCERNEAGDITTLMGWWNNSASACCLCGARAGVVSIESGASAGVGVHRCGGRSIVCPVHRQIPGTRIFCLAFDSKPMFSTTLRTGIESRLGDGSAAGYGRLA